MRACKAAGQAERAAGEQRTELEQACAGGDDAVRGRGQACAQAGPGLAAGEVAVVRADQGGGMIRGLQHHRRFPRRAAEDLPACLQQVGRQSLWIVCGLALPMFDEGIQAVHLLAAGFAQVAAGRAGEQERPSGGRSFGERPGNAAEQQVAEVVAVEGAEQDEGGGPRPAGGDGGIDRARVAGAGLAQGEGGHGGMFACRGEVFNAAPMGACAGCRTAAYAAAAASAGRWLCASRPAISARAARLGENV